MTNVTIALSMSNILSTAILAGFGLTLGAYMGTAFYTAFIEIGKAVGELLVGAVRKVTGLFRK